MDSNYQPLNQFLDDKFPITNKLTLFSHLAKTKYFFKFYLKSGFLQLGTHHVHNSKIDLCIPDYHYQWEVMSFGLKPATSLSERWSRYESVPNDGLDKTKGYSHPQILQWAQ